MAPKQFDAWSRTLAGSVSRRGAMARFGVSGLLAWVAGAAGRAPAGATRLALQAETCSLEIVANIRLGPSAGALLQGNVPGELRGALSFALGADGAVDQGRLRLETGTELPVVGQATGRAITLRVRTGADQTLVLTGAAERRLEQCTGAVDGLLTGPQRGDLGDWHATATPLGTGGAQPGSATATPVPAPGAPTATATSAAGAPTATAPAGATATATPAATGTPTPTATATATATTTPTDTPTPQPPTPTPVVCIATLTACGGVCVDLQIDVDNCGACGNVCPEGQPGFVRGCAAGNCFFMRAPACPPGLALCNDVCVDTLIDPANCGVCGNVCPTDEICFGGLCARDNRS